MPHLRTAIDFLAAHPRSRGEHTRFTYFSFDSGGSSPLARGTSCLILAVLILARLIPARAGNMTAFTNARRAASAHPRSRGEHIECRPEMSDADGSSPLARGTSINLSALVLERRLIPARAGNIVMG